MFGSIEIAAECRCQDMLAEAARYRLASQAQPIHSRPSIWREASSRASLVVSAAVRRALGSIAFVTQSVGGKARKQVGLGAAR